ncbi:hypothetical protein I4U23_003648 [Adineta vaga]|nr:hypothetical protein I4U23_003648 [Adineta vaga]
MEDCADIYRDAAAAANQVAQNDIYEIRSRDESQEDFDGQKRFARYYSIRIARQSDKYRLKSGAYTKGDAEDSLSFHNNTQFPIKDQDNDAWWYANCHHLSILFYKIVELTQIMQLKWIILLLFISFLQLVVTLPSNDSSIAAKREDGNHEIDDEFLNVETDPNEIFNAEQNPNEVLNFEQNPNEILNAKKKLNKISNVEKNPKEIIHIEKLSDEIDTSYYYRLMNALSGSEFALGIDDRSKTFGLKMNPVSDRASQFWRFVHLDDNVYSLRTRSFADQYALDIINNGINTTPHLALTGYYTGQRWHLIRENDGTFRLWNEFTTENMFFGVNPSNQVAQMSRKNNAQVSQRWNIVKIAKVVDN